MEMWKLFTVVNQAFNILGGVLALNYYFVVYLKVDEKTQTPQADEDQPAVTERGTTERGSVALERKTFVIVGQIPGGRERLMKLITDLGGRVLDRSVYLPRN